MFCHVRAHIFICLLIHLFIKDCRYVLCVFIYLLKLLYVLCLFIYTCVCLPSARLCLRVVFDIEFTVGERIQDRFHVFLNNFEMAIFLLFFKLFIIFFLHYVSVIFKKREPLIKLFVTAFVCLKLCCKMSGVILKRAKSV